MSKCFFGSHKVEYLGDYISAGGVQTDPKKVCAIEAWPIPVNVKQVRSFLGMTGSHKVEYLGHYISVDGVQTDPKKVCAIEAWPTLVNVEQFRSFLGMTGYYRNFFKNYALLAQPLTNLLKKGDFHWNDSTQKNF